MIIQAIGLLDDFHKELNTYAMRAREWYGWHFPELAKILQDNILYAKAVKLLEARLRNLAGRELGRSAGLAKGKPKIEAYEKDKKKGAGALTTAAKTYNPSADSILGQMEIWNAGNEEETVQKKRKAEPETLKTQNSAEEVAAVAVEKKKEKKKQKESNDTSEAEGQESIKKEKRKKKKKKEEASNEQNDTHNNEETGERKKKKRKHAEQDEDDETEMPGKKKEKKKKKIKKGKVKIK